MESKIEIVLEYSPQLKSFVGQTPEQRREIIFSIGTTMVQPENVQEAGRKLALDGHKVTVIPAPESDNIKVTLTH